MAGKSLASLDRKYRGKAKKFAEGGRARSPAAAPVASPFDADYIERLAAQAVGAGEPVTEVRSSEGRSFVPMPRSFGEAGQRMSAVLRGDVEPTPEEERQINVVRGFAEGPASIRAYHGSPHLFNRFDISKIGTGEGAQAYGHGLYFAESEPVARHYRDTLSRPYYELASGEPLVKKYGNDVLDVFENAAGDPNQINETINRLRNSVQRNLNDFGVKNVSQLNPLYAGDLASDTINMAKRADNLEDLLRSGDVKLAGQGHMYEVNLRTEPKNLLSFDAPIAAQDRRIRDELKAAGILKAYRENLSDFTSPMLTRNRTPRGENIMSFLEYSKGSPQAAASTLSDIGIPGVRYLDEGSRAAKRGMHNYVMFGDDLIDITRRYAEGGLAALDQKYAEGGTVRAPKETYISGQEHKLAYITDREAALLKAHGGSGRMTSHGIRAYDGDGGDGGDGNSGGDANDNSTSNSEASSQDAAGGNAGQGAGPSGVGAGASGEAGPGDNEGVGESAADQEDADQGKAMAATPIGTFSGFSPMSVSQALAAYDAGRLGLGQLAANMALSAVPGVTPGVNRDAIGEITDAISVSPVGLGLGLAGLATGVPGLSTLGGLAGTALGQALGVSNVIGTPSSENMSPNAAGGDQYTNYGASSPGAPTMTGTMTPAATTSTDASAMTDWSQLQSEANARNMSLSDYLTQKWSNPVGMAQGGLATLHQKYEKGGEVFPPAGEVAEYDPDEIDQIARQIHLRLPEDEREPVVFEDVGSPSDLTMRARMLMHGQNIGLVEGRGTGAGGDRFSSSTSMRDTPIEDDRYGVSQRVLNTNINAMLDAERNARIGAGMLALERAGDKGFTGYGPQLSAGYGPASVYGGYQSITPNMPGAKSQGSFVYGGNLNMPIDDSGTEANIGGTVMAGRRNPGSGVSGTQIMSNLERPFLGGKLALEMAADPSLRHKEFLIGYRRAF